MKNNLICSVIFTICFSAVPLFSEELPDQSLTNVAQVVIALKAKPADAVLLAKLQKAINAEKDETQKTYGLSIYYLGCLLEGKNDTAQKTKNYFQKNYPNSPYLAKISSDNYCIECASCRGTGKTELQCSACRGSGKCSFCNGAGQRSGIGNQSIRCSQCLGNGKCRECQGTGKKVSNCAKCRGQGKTIDQGKIKETYIALLDKNAAMSDQDKAKPQHDENKKREIISEPDSENKAKDGSQDKMDPGLVRLITGFEKELRSCHSLDTFKLTLNAWQQYLDIDMKKAGATEYKARMTSLFEQGEKCKKIFEKENVCIAFNKAREDDSIERYKIHAFEDNKRSLEFVKNQIKDVTEYKKELEAIKDECDLLKPKIERKIRWYTDKIAMLEKEAEERAEKGKKELTEQKTEEEKRKADEDVARKKYKEIYDKYKNQKAKEVDIKKVLLEPEKYKGEVLSSLVSFEGGGWFNPPFSTESGTFRLSVPKDIAEKESNAFSAVGQKGLVRIKYYWADKIEGETYDRGILLDISIPE